MKKIIFLSMMAIMVLINTGCTDNDILDHKDGVSMPAVTNLSSSISGGVATVTWSLPSNIPSVFARPLSINVQIYQYRPQTYNPIRVHMATLANEATSTTFTIPTDGYDYHIIVKLVGTVIDPPYGTSGTVYSLGQTVVVKL